MADNVTTNVAASAGAKFATASVTFSGDADTHVSMVGLNIMSGSEGSWVMSQIVGGAGAVAAGVQRVTLASDDPAVAKLTTIDADTSALYGCVAGTELQVDIVSSALPTGAATAAKQPALGTAGTPSADVITVQGVTSMTALKVDGSAVTQPVSGTVAVTGMTACNTGAVVISSGTISLPSGASTLAEQQSQTTHLATIAGDTTSLDGKVTTCNTGAIAGTVTANLSATDNAVLDDIAAKLTTIDADTSNIVACNTGAVVISSGAVTATLAAETTKVIGTVNIAAAQSVAATQSGTWNITNVSGTVSLPTGAATAALQGGGLPAALGAGGGLKVDGSGTALPVSGTVAVTGMTACNTGAVVLTTGTAEIGNVKNSGTFAVQAACVLGAETTKVIGTVNIAAAQTVATVTTVGAVTAITNALPAGTNAIGKLAANSGVDIGDVDVTSIAAGTNTIGGVIAQPSTSAAYDGTTSCTLKRLSGIATASGANTILTAVADKKFRVLALSLLATSTTAVVAYVYNGDYMLLGDGTNKLTLDMDGVGGPAGIVLPFNQGGWFQTDTANEALAINLGGATPVIWCVTYLEVA